MSDKATSKLDKKVESNLLKMILEGIVEKYFTFKLN